VIKLSQDNPDIRKQVEASRGPQKNLEMLIPGLRGYRTLEDLRVADNLLRNQVADKLDKAKSNLEDLRKQLVAASDYGNLATVGSMISQVQQLGGEVRHSQQGYSGWVATISIDAAKLNKLYEYDYDFVSSAIHIVDATSPSSLVYDAAAPASVQVLLKNIRSSISDFKQKWGIRIEAIENILVK